MGRKSGFAGASGTRIGDGMRAAPAAASAKCGTDAVAV